MLGDAAPEPRQARAAGLGAGVRLCWATFCTQYLTIIYQHILTVDRSGPCPRGP